MFVPDSKIFLWIAASAADLAAVYLNRTKTLLVKGLSTFLLKGNQFLIMAQQVYLKILQTVSS